jgi:predicted chitinase
MVSLPSLPTPTPLFFLFFFSFFFFFSFHFLTLFRFCATGLSPVIQKVKRALDRVKREKRDLWDQVGTAGMLCCRPISGTSTFSNHAWGSAIDLTVNGVLDPYGNGKVQSGLASLYPYFNAEGFYWGAGFSTEDGMHFELSNQEMNKLITAGATTGGPKFTYTHLTSVAQCAWPTIAQVSGSTVNPVAFALQYFLKYHCQTLTADGLFGPNSATALRGFQTSRGQSATGSTSELTWKALYNDVTPGEKGDFVRGIQTLLKLKHGNANLVVDGVYGDGVASLVRAFQASKGLVTTGVVDFVTFQYLVAGCAAAAAAPVVPVPAKTSGTSTPSGSAPAPMAPPASQVPPEALVEADPATTPILTAAQLRCVMPTLTSALADVYIDPLVAAMQSKSINTFLRVTAFLAQIGHESGELRWWSELGNCNYLEGRKDLGNTSPGDGCKYKGRGPLQLTGKVNYKAAGAALGLDLLGNPEQVAQPSAGFLTTAWFWDTRKLNRWADVGDFDAITYRVNGGYNGKAHRDQLYSRAQACLGGSSQSSGDGRSWISLKRGASGPTVVLMQWLLTHAKMMPAGCTPDGDFGPCTERAVRAYQLANNLGVDGACGPNCWSSLIVTVRESNASTMPNVVKALQTGLLKYRYTGPVDGKWTAALTTALTAFQVASDLDADAICGAVTMDQ